jgi:signal transduction histidine kinase/CheY-like chemotaxis protein
MADADAAPVPKRRLARRYALLVGAVSTSLLLASGASEMYFNYREARAQIALLQEAQAQTAAREIEQYLATIAAGVRDVTKLPWGQPGFGIEQKRDEFQRLMVLFPAIVEMLQVDAEGREQLFVSKSETDRIGALQPVAFRDDLGPADALDLHYGRPFFRADSPTLRVTAADRGAARTRTVAVMNLRFLGDVIARLQVGARGKVYVVDASNHLLAYPGATEVLRRRDLAAFAPVRQAREVAATGARALLDAADATDFRGNPVIATAVQVPVTGWLVFVEQPRSEALQSALATLTRTLLLMAIGGGLAIGASVLFANRMAAPIVRLRQATARIASGDLGLRLRVSTGDEIEQLANDFDRMSVKLQESYAGLEAKVALRTAELSEARDTLQEQAREMESLNARLVDQLEELGLRKEEAERANAAKTRFLAAASHDLRQPMHTIGLLVGVLRERLQEPRLVDLADKVQTAVAAMENLFGSLLDISKLDAGAIHSQVEAFALRRLLQHAAQVYGPHAVEAGLVLRVAPCRAIVRSDPVLVERILGNLVSNALRYTRAGGVLVGCRRRGDHVALQVIDTGPGIPPEHLEHVFEEFVRLDNAPARADKGLGLGLSIVRRSAEVLGHRLVVRSRVGHGTLFELLLPMAPELPADAGLAGPAAGDLDALAGAFVVIVDDDDENRHALRAVFEARQAHSVAASSPDDALRQLAPHLRAPDLIVTDYRLADGHDGFEAIVRVRELADEGIPAIVLTADVSAALSRRAGALDAVLLHKPANGARLLQVATELLARTGSGPRA